MPECVSIEYGIRIRKYTCSSLRILLFLFRFIDYYHDRCCCCWHRSNSTPYLLATDWDGTGERTINQTKHTKKKKIETIVWNRMRENLFLCRLSLSSSHSFGSLHLRDKRGKARQNMRPNSSLLPVICCSHNALMWFSHRFDLPIVSFSLFISLSVYRSPLFPCPSSTHTQWYSEPFHECNYRINRFIDVTAASTTWTMIERNTCKRDSLWSMR